MLKPLWDPDNVNPNPKAWLGLAWLGLAWFMLFMLLAPPPPAVRAGGAGGLVLPGETAAHASETLAYSGICVRHAHNSIRKAPSKASSPLAHQFCVFLSSSSARCCPAVPEPLLEPSTWPGAVIIGVRALALAPYLEPRGVYFILVLSSRARRPRTTREVRASHPRPPSHARSGPWPPRPCTRGPLDMHALSASQCSCCPAFR